LEGDGMKVSQFTTAVAASALQVAAAVVAMGGLATTAFAEDVQPSVTPYRPSVSTPAALSAPGWLEVEAGVQSDRGDASVRRDSLPYTLKLAFTPDWGIRLGGEAWVHTRDEVGNAVSGAGDTSVTLKRRFAIDDAHAFGLEAGATFPTGHAGISGEKTAYTVNGIYSADIGDFHTDINLAATRLGLADPGASRTQMLWAASLSGAVNDRWGWVGELSGTHQGGAGSQSQVLGAASYNASKTMTLDAGLSRALGSGERRWSVFAGMTVLMARLF
jgi:hypothetical protein